MSWFSTFVYYVKSLFLRRKLDVQLSEEIRTHVEMATEANVAKGMKPKEARNAALREFGNVASIQERTRDEHGWVWLEQIWQDMRYAVRSLAKTPGFTLTVIVTLGLGLGVNSALFTVFNAVALRSLPLRNPEELVNVMSRDDLGRRSSHFSYPDYLDLRAGPQGVRALAAWSEAIVTMDAREASAPSFVMRGGPSEALAYLPLQLVSQNFFDLVGADLALGRGFRVEESLQPGAGPVIVLQHQFWVQQFHGDPQVLGRTIKLRDTIFTVIGVAAPEFVGTMPGPPIGWVPAMMLDALEGNGAHSLTARYSTAFELVARVPTGAARVQAEAELTVLVRQLALKYPDKNRKTGIEFHPCGTWFEIPLNWQVLALSSPIWLCFALVLLIACTNVANLLLARATTRQQEIGVRLALGAGRGRILRHLLMESILVALAGGLAGLLVATWTLHAVRPAIIALVPNTTGDVRHWLFVNLTPDHRVFGFTFLLALVAALAAGLFPALLAARADVNAALKNDGSLFSRRSGFRHALVVVQVAVCLTLLTAAGVLVRQVLRNASIDTGLRAGNIYGAELSLRRAEVGPGPADAARGLMGDEATRSPTERRAAFALARTLPGIKTVARMHRVPFAGRLRLTPVAVDGGDAADTPLVAKFNFVSSEYFAMFGLVATKGRAFTAAEVQGKMPLVVVSEATARRFWPGEDPVGKRLRISSVAMEGGWFGPRQGQQPLGTFSSYEVIGVMPDARSGWVWETDETMLYLPLPEYGFSGRTTTLVQLTGPREKVLPLALGTAAAQGVQLSVNASYSLEEVLDFQLLPYKGVTAVGMALGALALVMSVVGLHGVMTFAINQRVREIGIRTALGATAEAIVGLFLRQGMRLVLLGLALGSLGGLGLALLLSKSVILGAQPFDPLACGGVALLLAVVALFACWLPARRAAKVNPAVTLRAE